MTPREELDGLYAQIDQSLRRDPATEVWDYGSSMYRIFRESLHLHGRMVDPIPVSVWISPLLTPKDSRDEAATLRHRLSDSEHVIVGNMHAYTKYFRVRLYPKHMLKLLAYINLGVVPDAIATSIFDAVASKHLYKLYGVERPARPTFATFAADYRRKQEEKTKQCTS